jgi:hypothetical protein
MMKPTRFLIRYGSSVYDSDDQTMSLDVFPKRFVFTKDFFEEVIFGVQKMCGVHASTRDVRETRIQTTGVSIRGDSWELVYGDFEEGRFSGVIRSMMPKKA